MCFKSYDFNVGSWKNMDWPISSQLSKI